MKLKKSKFIIVSLILILLFINIVYAVPKGSRPVYVNSPIPFVDNDLEEIHGERVVWSNYTKLFYIFTDFNGTVFRASTLWDIIGKSYSPDGVNWVTDALFFDSISHMATSIKGLFDFALSPDERYIWFIWKETGDNLYIIKCELFNNGSVIPVVARTQIYNISSPMTLYGWIDIEVSSEGYPFVSFCTRWFSGGWVYLGYVVWCNDDSGIWTQSGVYTFDSTLSWNKSDFGIERGKLLRLLDGKMGWAMNFPDTMANGVFKMYVGWYNGTAWEANTATKVWADTGFGYVIQGYQRSDSTSYKDTVVATYLKVGWEWHVRCFEYGGLNLNDTILAEYPWDNEIHYNPNVGVDYKGNILSTIFKEATDSVNYTYRYSNYTWGGLGLDNLTRWYDNNTQEFNYYQFTCSERSDNFLGFVYHDNSYSDTEILFDYISMNGTLLPVIMEYYNTTLYNHDWSVNDGWIFRGENYYVVSYYKGSNYFHINFTDGQHEIAFAQNNRTNTMYEIVDDQFLIGLFFSNVTYYDNDVIKAIWGFIPNTNIVDIEDTELFYYMINDEYSVVLNGTTGITFNIYNLGGFTYYSFNGDGGKTPYGNSAFDLYATNGTKNSWARAEQVFRKLQHINFLIEIDMDNEWESENGEFDIDAGVGYVDIGFDYRLNGSWIEGFKIKLYVQDANVGHHNLGIDHDWVEWSVDFYNYDPYYGYQVNLQSQLIYTNHWGYEHENYVPDYYNRTSSQLWVDLWFDKTNASTTIASQVNAYYHGLKEQGASWWFGYGTFIPMISNYDNAKFIDDLYDEGGNITNCQKYDLIKFYITVGKISSIDGDDETWRVRGIEDMHREQAIDRMMGIDEPTFVQTKVLDMPQTGFINAIKSALGNIANSITQGIFFTIKSLWAGVGWIFELMGLKEWYDAFSNAMGKIASYSLALMDNLQIALINSAILLEQLFELITNTIGRFTYGLTNFISSILLWYREIVNLFSGGGIWNINVWVTLSLGDWIGLVFNLLPVWWFIRIAESNDKIRTLQRDISFVIMITTGLFHFLSSIIILAATLINLLLGLLPI